MGPLPTDHAETRKTRAAHAADLLVVTIAATSTRSIEPTQHAEASALPGFARGADGRPRIGLTAEEIYAYGQLIRLTEELILGQFSRGLVSGTTHTCLGQEIAALSVVRALDHPEDAVLSNHRNHGHFLAYSGDFLGLVAEIMGREAGVCRGRGGSQHLAWHHFHSNGVQAGMMGIAGGLALARRKQARGGLVAAMIGDGTLGQGLVYESMNLASVWQAPLLVVVENNGIAQTTYTRETIGGSIDARGAAFGFATWHFSDDDPEFCRKVADVVAEVRGAGRPGYLVIDTRRMGPHSKGDDLRAGEEMADIRGRDPLAALGRRIPEAARSRIEARNASFIAAVRAQAEASPEARYAELPGHIFTASSPAVASAIYPVPSAGASVRQSLNVALRHLLQSAPEVLLLGEDLHDPYGGAFKVTQGLSTEFPGRVISTPISEAGVAGATIGLALAGFKPITEVMFADFLTLCMDQIYNHAVKFPGMFRDMAVPLVIRTPSGGRRGYGATHSQSPEHLFASVPGLTVVYGSHRHDVGRLLVDATLRWPYPVLFLEHKLLYAEKQDGAGYAPLAPAGDVAADLFPTLRSGDEQPDVTLLTYGGMLPLVEAAAKRLREEEELAVEIVVPSLLAPLPAVSLSKHLLERRRVAVVEESHHQYGVGAEIAATLLERGYRGRLRRIGAPPLPIPSARSLERQMLPDEARVVSEVLGMI
jgi:2-oxoisovalerate dehydrogenase E1 component